MADIQGVVTEYDLRLTKRELGTLFLFLDLMLPVNSAMPVAEPGEPRQRLSDSELDDVNNVRRVLFKVVHG